VADEWSLGGDSNS